jgi:hypothetical protein
VRRRLRWLAARVIVVGALTLAALAWWAVDRDLWVVLLVATGCVCVGMGAVMEGQPRWWRRLGARAASRRRLAFYRAQWELVMAGAGLARDGRVPQLLGHRFGGQPGERDLDVLTVQALPGQDVIDWNAQRTRLAAAWGRTRVRVHRVAGAQAPAHLELFCASRPLPAGLQRLSTAVDRAVDEAPHRAFPRTPRGAR